MRIKTFFIISMLLLLVSLAPFMAVKPAYAEGPYKYHKFPGPWTYEKDKVTVACVQIQPVYGDIPATLKKMKDYVVKAAQQGAEIIVFPELILKPCRSDDAECLQKGLAEQLPGPSSLEMEEIAKEYGVYIVYGFYEQDKSDTTKIYNTAAIIGPKGLIGGYRKMHPTSRETVMRGREPMAFDTPWGPVGVGICFDNYQYPELARTYALMGCRLMLNPTAITFGGDQDKVMLEGLSGRSVENFLFVASANRVKSRTTVDSAIEAGGLVDAGQSVILGPGGVSYLPLYYAGPASKTEEEMIIATLDLTQSDKMRNLGCLFVTDPLKGEPGYMPEIWATLWGTPATPAPNNELESKIQELEALKLQNAVALQNFYIAIAVAGVFLLSTIALAVVGFRRRKK